MEWALRKQGRMKAECGAKKRREDRSMVFPAFCSDGA